MTSVASVPLTRLLALKSGRRNFNATLHVEKARSSTVAPCLLDIYSHEVRSQPPAELSSGLRKQETLGHSTCARLPTFLCHPLSFPR